MGATTYEWMVERHDMATDPQQWRTFYGERPGWVFTHRDPPPIPGVDLRIVSGAFTPVYEEIVATMPAHNIWLLGGGDLVGQFDDGLLDEIWLGLTPVVLGAGAALLPRGITSSRMRFREARQSGQRVRIILDVERQA